MKWKDVQKMTYSSVEDALCNMPNTIAIDFYETLMIFNMVWWIVSVCPTRRRWLDFKGILKQLSDEADVDFELSFMRVSYLQLCPKYIKTE